MEILWSSCGDCVEFVILRSFCGGPVGHNQSYGALVIFGFSVEVVPYFSIFILYIYIY